MSSSLDIKSFASIKDRVLYCVHERDLEKLYSSLITIFDIIENLIDSQDEDLRNRVSLETYYEILRSARLLTNRFTQYLQVWMLEINKWFMIQNNDINFKTSIKNQLQRDSNMIKFRVVDDESMMLMFLRAVELCLTSVLIVSFNKSLSEMFVLFFLNQFFNLFQSFILIQFLNLF